MSDFFLEAKHALDPTDLSIRDAVESYTKAWNERLEYELFGAWRAGYDYVHIYTDDGLTRDFNKDGADAVFTETRYIHPSTVERPACPDGFDYLYTYDIASVPDHVLRKAWRGELDDYERINLDR